MRILFIGNSLTYWNDGLWFHLERLAASGKSLIHATTGARPSRAALFLKSLWARTGPRRAIAAGPWAVVVLQEIFPRRWTVSLTRIVPAPQSSRLTLRRSGLHGAAHRNNVPN